MSILIHQIATSDSLKGDELSWSHSICEIHKDTNLYTYKLWTKSQIKSLAASNHAEFYTNFDSLSLAQLANLGRFLILYVHGGFVLSADVRVFETLDNLTYDSNRVYLAQTTRILPLQSTTLGSYIMYSPQNNPFFKALIDNSLTRIQNCSQYMPYVTSYTSGRLLINSLKDSFDVLAFLPSEVMERNCEQKTIEGNPLVIHERCNATKTHLWQDKYITKINQYECYLRKKLHVDSNFCSFPLIGATALLAFLFFLVLLVRKRR